ncbi:uncharacterized protein LOC128883459 isoform X1 [Hylaeus volcanicus]|uniref:uncharacterized protein LOC128883459 isoform X1 n=1 Tax=Hylaeus volcanicus TaxID=313075 RepID=UPI0023B7D4C7|nr:uncharacterized protein LOC128883459 isoform X1 [Hylaeus volcanicus]
MLQKFLKYFLLYISYLWLSEAGDDRNITVWTNTRTAMSDLESTTFFLDLPLVFFKHFENACALVIFNTNSSIDSSNVIKLHLQKHLSVKNLSSWTYQPEKEVQWHDFIEAWEEKTHLKFEKRNKLDSSVCSNVLFFYLSIDFPLQCSSKKIQYIDVSSDIESFNLLDSVLKSIDTNPYLLMFFPFFNNSDTTLSRQLLITNTKISSSTILKKEPYISLKPTTMPIIYVTLIVLALTLLGFFLLVTIDTPTFFLKTVPPVNKEF